MGILCALVFSSINQKKFLILTAMLVSIACFNLGQLNIWLQCFSILLNKLDELNNSYPAHYFLSATSFLYCVGVLPMMKCATFTLCTIWKPSMLSHIWPAHRTQTLKCSEIFRRRQIFLFQSSLMCWRWCMDIMKVKNTCNPFYSCRLMLTDVFLCVVLIGNVFIKR